MGPPLWYLLTVTCRDINVTSSSFCYLCVLNIRTFHLDNIIFYHRYDDERDHDFVYLVGLLEKYHEQPILGVAENFMPWVRFLPFKSAVRIFWYILLIYYMCLCTSEKTVHHNRHYLRCCAIYIVWCSPFYITELLSELPRLSYIEFSHWSTAVTCPYPFILYILRDSSPIIISTCHDTKKKPARIDETSKDDDSPGWYRHWIYCCIRQS